MDKICIYLHALKTLGKVLNLNLISTKYFIQFWKADFSQAAILATIPMFGSLMMPHSLVHVGRMMLEDKNDRLNVDVLHEKKELEFYHILEIILCTLVCVFLNMCAVIFFANIVI